MINEEEALAIFKSIIEIVNYLHNKNIVHRNLKLSNMIYDMNTKEIFITDFSLARQLKDNSQLFNDEVGSPAYVSPEILNGLPYNPKPVDIWSLAVSFYTILVGNLPFYDSSPQKLFQKIKSIQYEIPM